MAIYEPPNYMELFHTEREKHLETQAELKSLYSHWRYQFAEMAMERMIGTYYTENNNVTKAQACRKAVDFANALLKELEKETING